MYARASVVQASLAVVGTVAAVAAYVSTSRDAWLAVAVLMASVVLFTLLVMAKTNKELMAKAPDRSAELTNALLIRWGRLHWVRTTASGLAFVSSLYLGYARAA